MKSLMRSFMNAINGIKITLNNERNFRIHLVVMAYVLFFSSFYGFEKSQYALMFLTFAVVLSAEMMNTAVEEIIDREFEGYHIMAKVAKDIAAGAVMVCAIAAVGVGLLLFFDVERIVAVFWYFINNPVYLVLLLLSLVISYAFIRGKLKVRPSDLTEEDGRK